MKLLTAELHKALCAKWFSVLMAVLLFAYFLVCLMFASADEKMSYSQNEVETIKVFAQRYADDSEGFAEYKEACRSAALDIIQRLNLEYDMGLESGADEKELEKKYEAIYSDPATFLTHVFSERIDDASLIAAYSRLNEVKSDFHLGVAMILKQSERNAAELREEFGMTPADPLYQYQIYAYDKYKSVSEKAVVGEELVFGWDTLFSFSYGDIFLFFALILLVGTLYFIERNSGMAPIICVLKHGRTKAAVSKIGAAAIMSVALTLLFSLLSFSVIGIHFGFSDPAASVQNIQALSLVPETWSIGGYYCYYLALKCLSAIAFTALLSVFAAAIVSEPVYYLSGALLFVVHFLCGTVGLKYQQVFRLNLYSLCNVVPVTDRLYVFQPFTSCFGYHIIAPILCVLLFVLLAAASIMIGNSAFSRRPGKKVFSVLAQQLKRKAGKAFPAKERKHYRRDVSLLRWEARKLLAQKSSIVILVLSLIAQIGISVAVRIHSEPEREARIYTGFILSEVKGAYSQNGEKCKWLLKIYSDPNDGLKYLDEAIASGVFPEQERERIAETAAFIYKNNLTDDFLYSEQIYERNTLLYVSGFDPVFIDETGILPVVTNRLVYPLYFLVLITCILVWTAEYGGKSKENHFANIMAGTRNGRSRTFMAKTRFSVFAAAVVSSAFHAIELLILIPGRSLDCLDVPLYSISAYSEANIGLSVGGYLLIVFAVRVASAVLFTLLSLSVSALVKNFTAAFSIVAGSTILPTLLFRAGLDFAGYASFVDFLSGNGMVLFSAWKSLFGSVYGTVLTYLIIFTIVTFAVTAVAYLRNGEKRRI